MASSARSQHGLVDRRWAHDKQLQDCLPAPCLQIYDFGVYASPAELQAATLAAASAEGPGTLSRASARHSTATHPLRSLLPCGRDALAHLVQAPTQMLPSNRVGHVSGSIDATLLLHAARDLPVEQLALEMQNVLERRNVKV